MTLQEGNDPSITIALGCFLSFIYTGHKFHLRKGVGGIPPTLSGGHEFFGAPKRKMPSEQGVIPFRSYKLFALILPSPCNASNNQSHFHSLQGTAPTLASQLMQSCCSQTCTEVELSWSWAALCSSLMLANFLPIPPLKLWFAILNKGMRSSRPQKMRTRCKLCWPHNKSEALSHHWQTLPNHRR